MARRTEDLYGRQVLDIQGHKVLIRLDLCANRDGKESQQKHRWQESQCALQEDTHKVASIGSAPLSSIISHWADNEQHNHLFGFWFGHDMFTPPFNIYPEMDKNTVLFGGTDPGRFCPTYMVFCESFIPPEDRRDP